MKLKNYFILLIGFIFAVIGWIMLSDIVIICGYTLIVVGFITIFCKGNIKKIVITCTVIAVLVVGIMFLNWIDQTNQFDFFSNQSIKLLAWHDNEIGCLPIC